MVPLLFSWYGVNSTVGHMKVCVLAGVHFWTDFVWHVMSGLICRVKQENGGGTRIRPLFPGTYLSFML